jgi:hypothetical protein
LRDMSWRAFGWIFVNAFIGYIYAFMFVYLFPDGTTAHMLIHSAFCHVHVTQVLCPFESILLWPPRYYGILCRHLSKYNSSSHVHDLLDSQVHNFSQFLRSPS